MADHPQTQTSDNRFMLAAGAMMVLIVALLAGLSIKYHRRATRAETKLSQLNAKTAQKSALLDRILQADPEVARPAISRKDLTHATVKLNGREVEALLLPLEEALPIGFEADDVIIVEPRKPAATTQPGGG